MKDQDEELYRWLLAFGARTGYPILVNTSLNRGGEPIVETPADALEMFLDRPDIDLLLVGRWLVVRRAPDPVLGHERLGLGDRAILTTVFCDGSRIHNVGSCLATRPWTASPGCFETARPARCARP